MAKGTARRRDAGQELPQEPGHGDGRAGDRASEVHVSAVISTYLLTHLHHVLQRAEYGAERKGQANLAANYAQLRRLLCQEARSMGRDEDAPGSRAV